MLRFALRRDKTRWIPVLDAPPDDEALASQGYVLAGPALDLSHLDPERTARLLSLLQEPSERLSAALQEELGDLLETCPRKPPVPPLDLDIKDKMDFADRVQMHTPLLMAISGACSSVGLGSPEWWTTGGTGFHGHLIFPDGFHGHPDLLRVVGEKVREMARSINLPLLSDHREKESRPPVVLDDSLFARTPRSRGVIWRLASAPSPKGGCKFRIEGLDAFAPAEPVEASAIDTSYPIVPVERKVSISSTQKASRLDSEIATWQRVKQCKVCGHARCRVSPDGTTAYCFRNASAESPGELVMLRGKVTFKASIPPAERADHPMYLQPEMTPDLVKLKIPARKRGIRTPEEKVNEDWLKKTNAATKLFERHCTCGMAWFHRVCTHPRHDGQPQTLRKSPLSCGTTHVCRKCARSMQNKVRDTRTELLRKFMGEEIAIIKGWTDRPMSKDDACDHFNWIYQATELQTEMGAAKRSTEEPGLSYIGGELWSKEDSLPYRPTVLMVVPRMNVGELIMRCEEKAEWANFHVDVVTPEEASQMIADACVTLTYVPRTQDQKHAQIRGLHGRRCIRSYRKMPAIEHWSRAEIAELRIEMKLDIATEECEEQETCPVCKTETDPLYIENHVQLPGGKNIPWVRGGLKTHKLVRLILRESCRSPG